MRKITLLFFTFFFTSLGYSQLPLEGFEGTFPPTNWAVFDTNVGGTTNWATNVNACQGTLAAYMNRQNIAQGVTSEEYLATRSVLVPINGELRFFSRSFTSGNQGTIYEVKIAPATSTQNNPASYTTTLATYTEDQLSLIFSTCDEKVITIPPAFVGTSVYIAFVMKYTQPTAGLSGDRWILDNVQVVEKCLDPTALAATPSATGATLNWTGTGASFDIEHIQGTTPPTGVATGTSTTNSFNQTGSLPNTQYCYYVRAVCSASSSAWVGPFCYTTTTLPPECGGNFVDPGGVGGSNTVSGAPGNYGDNITAATGTTVICPPVGQQVTVTFTTFNTEAGLDLLRIYDGNAAVAANLLGTYSGIALPPSFTSSAANGCLTFVFTTDGSVNRSGWVANIICAPPPTCPRPTAVVATIPAGITTASIGWTNVGPATSWQIITLPCGSPAPSLTSTGIPAPTNPFTLTGLSSGTCYDVYVRAICSTTDISNWSFIPLSVTTLIAPPECGGNFIDPGGIGGSTTASDAPGNYANGVDSTVTICPPTGSGQQVTVTFTSFNTEANWDGLLVYEGNSTDPLTSPQISSANGTGNGFFTTVTGAFWGAALPGPFTSSNPNGCLTFRFVSDGSVNRAGWTANITCTPQPPCLQPIGLTATLPTSNSVVLSWISSGTLFNIEYGPVGFTQGSGTVITGVTNPYTLTGLNSSTQYSYYVQNNCGPVNGLSSWAGPINFTTQPNYCAGDHFYDQGGVGASYSNNSNISTTICAANVGDQVTVLFNSFAVDAGDSLSIYDGSTAAAANLLGTFNGTINPSSLTSTLGCLTFVFVSNGFTTAAGWDATIICSPPPTCSKPIALTATSVTTTSALLDWTQPLNPNGSLPTSWEILVVPLNSPSPVGNQPGSILTSTHPFLYTGLTPGTKYTFYVRAICGPNDASFWSTGLNFNTLIINDECGGAIFAPVNANADCNLTVAGTITGATASTPTIGAPCVGTADDDSWFQFIATNTYLNVSLQNIVGAGANLNHAVYSGNCNALTLLYCNATNSSTANGLTIGQTYYVRVYSDQDTPQTVDFDLCISTPSTCETSSTICNVNYANTTGVTSLGTVGCLFTSPNPTFFTIQITGNGPINYLLTQSTTQGGPPNLDVDYAAWGPFSSQAAVCAAMGNPPANPLTGLTTGCSYSAAPTENFNIASAVAGQFYVILITNFSNNPGFISLTQTNAGQPGAGVTFCCSDAIFSYPSYTFCKNGGPNPVITLGNNSVTGIFSSLPATGLVFVSTSTGEIDLAASAPGNYIVTNTLAPTTTCALKQYTYTVQITEPQTASIAYPAVTYCNSVTTIQPVTLTGSTSGTYSSSPVGLFINTTNGGINPSLSAPGIYSVVYSISSLGGCPTFTTTANVEIIAKPVIPNQNNITACNSYTLPSLSVGNYYTQPSGAGTQLNSGDVLTTSQTIYVYAVNGICSDEKMFTLTINVTPQVPTLQNVSQCSNFILPVLTVGNYYTQTGGTGTLLTAGTEISTPQTIYIYAQTGSNPVCFTESSFTVTIGALVVTAPPTATYCDSYTLPLLTIGNYFTQTGGTGTQLNAGDIITSTQTIYVYAVDGVCIDEDQFTVTINTITADNPVDVFACDSYTLPALSNGNNYYTAPNGSGTLLPVGTVITSTQTIYIYAQTVTTPNCTDQNSFVVTIYIRPIPDAPANVSACSSYTLPNLTVGNYFTQTNGGGTQLTAGTVITSTQTVYVFAQNTLPGCSNENSFTITINSIVAQTINNTSACNSYTLPALNANNSYFTGPNGTGAQLIPGSTITATQTIYIYAQTGTTPNCTNQSSFVVTITPSPVVQPINDVNACDNYTLPSLSVGNYFTQTNGGGTQLAAGTILTTSQTIYVFAQNGTNCSDEENFDVAIAQSPQFTITGDCVGPVYTLSILGTIPANADYQWYNGSSLLGTNATQVISSSGSYSCIISVPNGSDECSTTELYQAVDVACIIPKGISPNADGDNDSFNLSGFNVTKLNIYNRYGTKVYTKAQYVDEWYGQADNGNELPDGTYYYVIERANSEAKTGWVYINRNAN
jgi:gliding motility-associated-like protein